MEQSQQTALFLRQSSEDAWAEYEKILKRGTETPWDYILLTASNDEQANSYRRQIASRLEAGRLPGQGTYIVLPDPMGQRIGSGGATLAAIAALRSRLVPGQSLAGCRALLIHSGGDSRRIPQYSALGKLFSPIPRMLPDGRQSTLFDEFMITFATMPSRMEDGLVVLSGDVVLLFNSLQVDFHFCDAGALSMLSDITLGTRHGVFIPGPDGMLRRFLHKCPEATLREQGAVTCHDQVNLDTGAVLLRAQVLDALFDLQTDGGITVRQDDPLSFYEDFLYPMAADATRETYLAPYADRPEALALRGRLFDALRPFRVRVFNLSPSVFLHFGTTREMLSMFTERAQAFSFLGWQQKCGANEENTAPFACSNSYVAPEATVAPSAYIENSMVLGRSSIGPGCVISGVCLRDADVPGGTVMHHLKLSGGGHVVRVYGTDDNPKALYGEGGSLLSGTLDTLANAVGPEILWCKIRERSLWTALIYPVCETEEEAVHEALRFCEIMRGSSQDAFMRMGMSYISLEESFARADIGYMQDFAEQVAERVMAANYIHRVLSRQGVLAADSVFGGNGPSVTVLDRVEAQMAELPAEAQYRVYFHLSRSRHLAHDTTRQDAYAARCFDAISRSLRGAAGIVQPEKLAIARDLAVVETPVRVNFGGGWSDTPPYCLENGGAVLNAAIQLDDRMPIRIEMKRLDTLEIILESVDAGMRRTYDTLLPLRRLKGAFDPFLLHKSVLIACGIIPREGATNLGELLRGIGGGFLLSASVRNIPRGSGLGTSSILAGACVRAVMTFFGRPLTDEDLFTYVLCVEQLMGTGGGWQDQIGGLVRGIKMITTRAENPQRYRIDRVSMRSEDLRALSDRFVLIDTGQRRLARNLLRDVMGRYIAAEPEAVRVLARIQRVAALMRFELERGDIDAFAELMDEHWALSKALDPGTTNTCIDQILMAAEPFLAGRMICGAGGGGFLQGVLKPGVPREDMEKQVQAVFHQSGVNVRTCRFV